MPRIQPLLPFLRPLGTSVPAASRQCFRFSTAIRLHDAAPQSTTSSPKTKKPRDPNSKRKAARAADLAEAESRTEADSAQPPAPKPVLPSKHEPVTAPNVSLDSPPLYSIQMTKNNLWPIYHDRKRGGNLKFTQVCKVEGNLKQLGRELQAVLGKTKDEVIVKGAIGQVCVKGHHRDQVREFLQNRGIVTSTLGKTPAL